MVYANWRVLHPTSQLARMAWYAVIRCPACGRPNAAWKDGDSSDTVVCCGCEAPFSLAER